MTEDELKRVREARERALAEASRFFESLTPAQRAEMEERARKISRETCPRIDHEEIAANFESSGIMARADYLEMSRIIGDFQAGKSIADEDLETMLRYLREASGTIVRCRVLTFLGELVGRTAPAPDRVARIEEAIAPWRDGPEDLDILSWSHVRKALDEIAR